MSEREAFLELVYAYGTARCASFFARTQRGLEDQIEDKTGESNAALVALLNWYDQSRAASCPEGMVLVDRGALKMALNVLRRAEKNEVADALEAAAISERSEGMKVHELIAFLQTQPQDIDVAYQCYSEQVLLRSDLIHVETLCAARADGWIENGRPDKDGVRYLVFPGN